MATGPPPENKGEKSKVPEDDDDAEETQGRRSDPLSGGHADEQDNAGVGDQESATIPAGDG